MPNHIAKGIRHISLSINTRGPDEKKKVVEFIVISLLSATDYMLKKIIDRDKRRNKFSWKVYNSVVINLFQRNSWTKEKIFKEKVRREKKNGEGRQTISVTSQ